VLPRGLSALEFCQTCLSHAYYNSPLVRCRWAAFKIWGKKF